MRFNGRLGLVDVPIPGFDVELEVDRGLLLLRRCGQVLGAWELAECDLQHDAGRRFVLQLRSEPFSFTADDALKVVHDALPAFSPELRQSRRRGRRQRAALPRLGAGKLRASLLASANTVPLVAPGGVGAPDRRIGRRAPALPLRHQVLEPGAEVAYLDVGTGSPLVFVDGGIAGIELWRDVIPQLTPSARCIAFDLVGTGRSGPMPVGYKHSWDAQAGFLGALLDDIGLGRDVTLVLHGWGSLVGLAWAMDNEDRVCRICHIEAAVAPLTGQQAVSWYADVRRSLTAMARAVDRLEPATFVSGMLEELTASPLPERLVAEILRPFDEDTESRALRALLQLLPIAEASKPAMALAERAWDFLRHSPLPKLLVVGQPGFLLADEDLQRAMTLSNQVVASVEGRHFLPLESPDAVGRFLRMWLSQRG